MSQAQIVAPRNMIHNIFGDMIIPWVRPLLLFLLFRKIPHRIKAINKHHTFDIFYDYSMIVNFLLNRI